MSTKGNLKFHQLTDAEFTAGPLGLNGLSAGSKGGFVGDVIASETGDVRSPLGLESFNTAPNSSVRVPRFAYGALGRIRLRQTVALVGADLGCGVVFTANLLVLAAANAEFFDPSVVTALMGTLVDLETIAGVLYGRFVSSADSDHIIPIQTPVVGPGVALLPAGSLVTTNATGRWVLAVQGQRAHYVTMEAQLAPVAPATTNRVLARKIEAIA